MIAFGVESAADRQLVVAIVFEAVVQEHSHLDAGEELAGPARLTDAVVNGSVYREMHDYSVLKASFEHEVVVTSSSMSSRVASHGLIDDLEVDSVFFLSSSWNSGHHLGTFSVYEGHLHMFDPNLVECISYKVFPGHMSCVPCDSGCMLSMFSSFSGASR